MRRFAPLPLFLILILVALVACLPSPNADQGSRPGETVSPERLTILYTGYGRGQVDPYKTCT